MIKKIVSGKFSHITTFEPHAALASVKGKSPTGVE
jgi:hypothetical protein